MPAAPQTRILAFGSLSVHQLYAALRLRSAVFVVEQACVYQDVDGRDEAALHVLVEDGRGLVAYARLLPPGVAHDGACAIGRVVTHQEARGEGFGKAVMRASIRACRRRWPQCDILLHGQAYLLRFYSELGFVAEGDPFLEDGIPHRRMRAAAPRNDD